MKCCVYWSTKDTSIINRIRERAKIPKYTTLNGLSPCECDEATFVWLKECEKYGAIRVRDCEWTKSGGIYSFKRVNALK